MNPWAVWRAKRIAGTQRSRMLLSAAIGFAFNLLYAFYHGALGTIHLSLWLLTMCAFYGILATMRFSAVLCGYRNRTAAADDTEYFVMKLSGILLSLLSFILGVVIYLSLAQNIATQYGEITMITIAAYTFFKITMAIVKAVKQRKNPSVLLSAIRSIGYAEVAASVLTLQRSMLVSFGGMSYERIHKMNAMTGAAACLFVLVLGVSMIRKGLYNGKIQDYKGE